MTAHQQGRLQPPVSDDDHSAGPPDAPVTLVEYGDFQCPYCFRAHPIVLKLQERLGDKLRFVFRNFPIAELHQHAVDAAQAAESVGSRAGAEAYWRMHHLIFEHQQDSKDALTGRTCSSTPRRPERTELTSRQISRARSSRSAFSATS